MNKNFKNKNFKKKARDVGGPRGSEAGSRQNPHQKHSSCQAKRGHWFNTVNFSQQGRYWFIQVKHIQTNSVFHCLRLLRLSVQFFSGYKVRIFSFFAIIVDTFSNENGNANDDGSGKLHFWLTLYCFEWFIRFCYLRLTLLTESD